MKKVVILIASVTALTIAGTRAKSSTVNDAPTMTVSKSYSANGSTTGEVKDRTNTTKATDEQKSAKKKNKAKKEKAHRKNCGDKTVCKHYPKK